MSRPQYANCLGQSSGGAPCEGALRVTGLQRALS